MMGLQGLQDKAKGHDPSPTTASALQGGTGLWAPHFNECSLYSLQTSKPVLGFHSFFFSPSSVLTREHAQTRKMRKMV